MKKTFKMLHVGRQYFPLNDVGRKFKVQDTVDYEIKYPDVFFKTGPTKNKMFNALVQVDMLNDYIERTVWQEIQKDNYTNVTWCRISHITTSVHNSGLTISVDLLEEVK